MSVAAQEANALRRLLQKAGSESYPPTGLALDFARVTPRLQKLAEGAAPLLTKERIDKVQAGLKAGDIITSVDGKPMKDGDALVTDIAARISAY